MTDPVHCVCLHCIDAVISTCCLFVPVTHVFVLHIYQFIYFGSINFYMCHFGDIRNSIHEKKSRNSVKFRGISRNYTTRNSAEFRRNCSHFRTEYGIDGSKKNRRNSVSAEFRGHPSTRLDHEGNYTTPGGEKRRSRH